MRISAIAICALLLSSPAWAAEAKPAEAPAAKPASPTAAADAGAPPVVKAPAAEAVSPAAAASLSPSAAAADSTPTAAAEPEIEDDAEAVTSTAALDLALAETRLLAKISETLTPEQDKILFNVEDNSAAAKPGPGVNEVDALALYAELAKRTVAEDKDALQALRAAALRGDKRAIDAKQDAYEERLANSLIKRIENGDKGAKNDLTAQALKGNRKARLYLGMDKPVAVSIPELMTPTAKAEDAPKAASPAAEAAPAAPAKTTETAKPEEHKPAVKGTGY